MSQKFKHFLNGSSCKVTDNQMVLLCCCAFAVQVNTNVALSSGQYWDIINLSADAHPIHLSNVEFQVKQHY
jgi:hypothetical protein